MKKAIICLLILSLLSCQRNQSYLPYHLELDGEWSVYLDSIDQYGTDSIPDTFPDAVYLPGTTDDAQLGTPNSLEPELTKPQLLHLTRKHSYIGSAYYTRNVKIPTDWNGRRVILHLERVMWESQVWVNDVNVGPSQESLIAPHEYDLTEWVNPGESCQITIRVNNRKKYDISIKELAHAYTEDTQVKWNGIIGDIYLEAVPDTRISDISTWPDASKKDVTVKVSVENNGDAGMYQVCVNLIGNADNVVYTQKDTLIHVPTGTSVHEITLHLSEKAHLWDEFNPYLYRATASINTGNSESVKETVFGLRDISHEGSRLLINGKPLFLRGTLECCIFPLTGTPPMEKDGWYKVFNTAREYGLNHLRFHSWCPPEVAFDVADELGFYLQIELPVWSLTVGQDPATSSFLRDEAYRIIDEYGDHPSFCLWSLGNELEGDFDYLKSLVQELKIADSRHLYTTTSFTFQNGHGVWPEADDDFFVTQWTNNGWVRGQGVFNQYEPSFDKDYRTAITGMQVPLITHEIGQYSVYPDIKEIDKYTGTLLPLNFMAVKEDLEKKGLLDKAEDYLMSSGKLAAILYKEEIERALKTPGISGFQLLDLHDFPGQGTALVGLLNAFWDSKGVISGEEFSMFCSPVVPLLRFPKATYENNETFEAVIELSNYSAEELNGRRMLWTVLSEGNEIASGQLELNDITIGHNADMGKLVCDLSSVNDARQVDVCVSIAGTGYQNSWKIWVYPTDHTIVYGDVKYTRDYNQALSLLSDGHKVLFNPDWKTMKGIEGKFVPVFWSPVHFPNQAGTMGLLCDPKHPVFDAFPTDDHTDWQWWDLNINSTTMVTDSLEGGTALVEMIDNFLHNRRMASLYEGKVAKGNLVIATFDLTTSLETRPVARQMLKSILAYMNSDKFTPSEMNGFENMGDIFGTAHNSKQDASAIY